MNKLQEAALDFLTKKKMQNTKFDLISLLVEWQKQQVTNTPVICPVCLGKGKLWHGFYNTHGQGVTTSITDVTCRTCNGLTVLYPIQVTNIPTKERLIELIEEIQERNYNKYKGSNECDLHTRIEVADLLTEPIGNSEELNKELLKYVTDLVKGVEIMGGVTLETNCLSIGFAKGLIKKASDISKPKEQQKELTEITDEDAIEVLNILMGTKDSMFADWDKVLQELWLKKIKLVLTDGFGSNNLAIQPYFSLVFKCCIFLQSRGYNLTK